MYDIADDIYCYPGTAILINKLEIREQHVLDDFEAEMTAQRATEPMPPGSLDFAHYRAVHRHLFQDVYAWAGQPRKVRISKGGNPFCFPEYIEDQANRLFAALAAKNHLQGLACAEFAKDAARFLTELNAIHAFREGNGRAQLSFLALLAERAGHPLDLDRLDPAQTLAAMIASFDGNEGELANLIAGLAVPV